MRELLRATWLAAAWAGTAIVAAAQEPLPPQPLRLGETRTGELRADAAKRTSRSLANSVAAPNRGDTLLLGSFDGEAVTIEVRSPDFDAFAQLLDANGNVLAEDDGSAGAGDARFVLKASAASGKTLVILGKRGQLGVYEVEVLSGSPEPAEAPAALARLVSRAEAALRRQEERHGPESLPAAERCLVLARVLCKGQRGADALPLLQRSLRIREQELGEVDESVAECWRDLGLAQANLGRAADALAAFVRCREVLAYGHGDSHRGLPALLMDIAEQQEKGGKHAESLATLAAAIEIFDRQRNPELVTRAVLVLHLADKLEADGRHEDARQCVRAMVPLLTRAGNSQRTIADIAMRLAERLYDCGDVPAAVALFATCHQVLRKHYPRTHRVTVQLAWLEAVLAHAQARSDDLAAAVGELRVLLAQPGVQLPWGGDGTAAALAELEVMVEPANAVTLLMPRLSAAAVGSPEYVRMLSIVALALERSGRSAEALPLLEQALNEATLARLPPTTAQRLTLTAASVFADCGQPAVARSHILRVLAASPLWPSVGRVSHFDFLACRHAECGDMGAAVRSAMQANTMALALLDRDLPCLPDAEALQLYAALRPTLDLLLGLARKAPADIDSTLVFAYASAWQMRVLRGEIGDRRRARERFGEASLAMLDRLRAMDSELAVLSGPVAGAGGARQAERHRLLLEEREEAERQLAELAIDKESVDTVSLAKVQEHLLPNEAFVDYVTFSSRVHSPGVVVPITAMNLVAFLVRATGPVQVVWLGPTEPIEAALATAMQLVGRRVRPDATGRALEARALQQLADKVLLPLLPHLHDVRVLDVVTDGIVAMVPFAALPGRDPSRMLVEDVEVRMVASASDLVAASAPSAPTSLLLLGDVDFGGDEPFQPLPGTAAEIDAIAREYAAHCPNATSALLLRGEAPTVASVGLSVPTRTHVHLATHGFLGTAMDVPQALPVLWKRQASGDARQVAQQVVAGSSAGIALADANRNRAAVMRAGPLSWLDLRACELAVLSACDSGVGRPFAGEQVLGLRRSLRLAGARRTMTTLWRVDDQGSAVLMTAFYRELWRQGVSPGTALRTAQLAQLAANRQKHGGDPLPALWAGYVVEGLVR